MFVSAFRLGFRLGNWSGFTVGSLIGVGAVLALFLIGMAIPSYVPRHLFESSIVLHGSPDEATATFCHGSECYDPPPP